MSISFAGKFFRIAGEMQPARVDWHFLLIYVRFFGYSNHFLRVFFEKIILQKWLRLFFLVLSANFF
jgi:hypothetical protein